MFFCAAFAFGCAEKFTAPSDPEPLTVELAVSPASEDTLTRAADESIVRDVNLFLYTPTGVLAVHQYSDTASVRFEALPGRYRMFVLANLHRELGAMPLVEMLSLAMDAKSDYVDLPMSAEKEVEITKDGSAVFSVIVRRAVAKVAYNVHVGDTAAGIVLSSVRAYNVPRRYALFGAAPSESPDDYTAGRYISLPDGAKSCSGVLYLPENRQGTVPAVQDPKEKNRDNAPTYATYLLIRAALGSRMLDYTVYLGENETDNFDVGRNTFHTLDITIFGDNEIDTRVHGYTLSVRDDMEADALGGYCTVDSLRSLTVDVEGNSREMRIFGEVEITSGSGGHVWFGRDSRGGYHEFDARSRGRTSFRLAYMPPLVTEAASVLRYSVTVQDEYGGGQTFDFEHRFANELRIIIPSGSDEASKSKGRVAVRGALYSEAEGSDITRTLCDENGCRLSASANAG